MKLTLPPGQIAGIFGPVSSGKTFLIDSLTRNENRKVIFDYTGEAAENPENEVIEYNPKLLNEALPELNCRLQVCG